MKVCNQCGQTMPMDTKYCLRCGSGNLRVEGGTQVEKPKQSRFKSNTLDNIEAQPQKVPNNFKNPNAVKMPKMHKKIKQPKEPKQPKQVKQNNIGGLDSNTSQEFGYTQEQNNISFGGYGAHDSDVHVSVKEWFFTMLLMAIPIFGIYYVISLAFSSKKNVKPSLRNWAKLSVYIMGISIGLSLIFGVVVKLIMGALLSY